MLVPLTMSRSLECALFASLPGKFLLFAQEPDRKLLSRKPRSPVCFLGAPAASGWCCGNANARPAGDGYLGLVRSSEVVRKEPETASWVRWGEHACQGLTRPRQVPPRAAGVRVPRAGVLEVCLWRRAMREVTDPHLAPRALSLCSQRPGACCFPHPGARASPGGSRPPHPEVGS